MSKTTAIIDIGSNSARLVIYEASSQYGFHLICEKKSKVRIGEGAYEKGGYLQPIGINRAYFALREFINTIKLYSVTKTICVATSALRDAPNGSAFTKWIKKELQLDIKIIDGKQEARFGAIAALNLLPIQDGITIDIGGGSSDLALIKNSQIVDTYSINIGTVRLKELFFDKNRPIQEAEDFIRQELLKLPSSFRNREAIGIGGTARTLAKAIMKKETYPLDKLHAFSYKVDSQSEYFSNIALANKSLLPYLYISKARFDTIREGTLIFQEILKYIGAKRVITSGVGVREGVFLSEFLKDSNLQFPKDINPSIVSILDRFKTHNIHTQRAKSSVESIFRLFHKKDKIKKRYLKTLIDAIKITPIGYTFNIYKSYQHAFYATMQEFNYRVTHKEIILTALLLRFGGKGLYEKEIYKKYKTLLPSKKELEILSFIYSISITLHENSSVKDFSFSLDNNTLIIKADNSLYLAKEKLKEIERPPHIKLEIIDKQVLPEYSF
jgi:exopolyphosphatase/guanosine-5'-triphosphate,3'-diphosphate pyrophosphatase